MKITCDLQDQIDLLVDDELNDSQRASLIEELDRVDGGGGWRFVAMTFLEAREISRAFELSEKGSAYRVKKRRGGILRPALAIAAVFCAFVLGWATNLGNNPVKGKKVVESPQNHLPVKASASVSNTAPLISYYRLAGGGDGYYATRYELPAFMIQSLQESGHQVLKVQRSVEIAREDGEMKTYPVTETRIIEAREL